ncbi:hypothetical protein Poli38472_005462 [Pythium oligandrum]|uniref:Methylated-DNA--protein-cysteine methyltransferase n=1 Tax=Pythium oligandrum TaxID=41045 RepID=A0A8K1CG16_PYTOL|nr:hypothetical protein Poli38472_005462 [Pythium oligandrum]|eukprot:TMW62844.1 hypothetical protein Poli38472_005462 [Pythium oligandrum]
MATSRVLRARRATSTATKKATSQAGKKTVAKATQHIEWRGHRMTTFEKSVYELISTIPAGKVSTYGDVAKALSSGPRPVGQALRKNPLAPEVPCHRVVAGTLSIGGFKGQFGEASPCIAEKRELLGKEGVTFTKDLKIDQSCLHQF